MLEAYFDESERTASGVFCLAGYAFLPSRARAFAAAWAAVFADYGGSCHMADLNAREKAFKGITPAKSKALCVRAVQTINAHAAFAVGVSCDLDELQPMLPQWINGFEHAYTYFCDLAILQVAEMAGSMGTGGVNYFFESGQQYEGAAKRFLDTITDIPDEKVKRLHASHDFVGKGQAPQLQAADLLAWEVSKHRHEINIGSGRPLRLSLAELLTGRRTQIKHLTGEPLRSALLRMHIIGKTKLLD